MSESERIHARASRFATGSFLLVTLSLFLAVSVLAAAESPHEHLDVTILHYYGYQEETELFKVKVLSVDTKNVYVLWLSSAPKNIRSWIGKNAVISVYDSVWKTFSLGADAAAPIERVQRIE